MDAKQLNDEGRELWNNKAAFWDDMHGDDGNSFHQTLIGPSVEELLDLQAGERVLDIGCGSGVLARRLAELEGIVTAFDFSEELVKLAQARGQTSREPIDYLVVDATDEAAMVALGAGTFDAITCTMTLMDVPVIEPIFRAVNQLLKNDGRFVYSTAHPAFNSNNPIFVHDKIDVDGVVSDHYAVKLRTYLDMPPVKGSGSPNEPNPHYYYHRPMHELLGVAFANGLVMDGLLEPAYPPDNANKSERLDWRNLWQIPPVITARLRKAK